MGETEITAEAFPKTALLQKGMACCAYCEDIESLKWGIFGKDMPMFLVCMECGLCGFYANQSAKVSPELTNSMKIELGKQMLSALLEVNKEKSKEKLTRQLRAGCFVPSWGTKFLADRDKLKDLKNLLEPK